MKKIFCLLSLVLLLSACSHAAGLESYSKDVLTEGKNLLFIWQPQCGHCEEELKELEGLYKNYDMNIISVGVNDTEDAYREKIEEWGLSFPTYQATEEYFEEVKTMTSETPSIFFLKEDGTIFKETQVGRAENLKELLDTVQEYDIPVCHF